MSRPTDDARDGDGVERADAASDAARVDPSTASAPVPAPVPAAAADSAGVPWAGRSFDENRHAADDGRAPERLAEAQRRFVHGEVGAAEVVEAFRDARLLIPLVARLGDGGDEVGAHGLRVEKSQELSIVTVAGPDGRSVLPVFSSVDTMAAWNPEARPVPADGVRVALAAASEQTELVVLDPGSDVEFVLRRPALWAIGQQEPWTPSHADPQVRTAFERSVSSELAVLGVALADGDPAARLRGPELVVTLTLVDALSRDELDAALTRLARRWAEDDVIATRVDSVRVRLAASA